MAPAAPLSVNEVMDRYLDYAEVYYRRPDGTPTSEIEEYKLVVRTVRQLYGNTPAVQFGPKRLQAVRQHMINARLSGGSSISESGESSACSNGRSRRS